MAHIHMKRLFSVCAPFHEVEPDSVRHPVGTNINVLFMTPTADFKQHNHIVSWSDTQAQCECLIACATVRSAWKLSPQHDEVPSGMRRHAVLDVLVNFSLAVQDFDHL